MDTVLQWSRRRGGRHDHARHVTARSLRLTTPESAVSFPRELAAGRAIDGGLVMFGFFSTRLGCAGSLLVSVVVSALMILLLRGCTARPGL